LTPKQSARCYPPVISPSHPPRNPSCGDVALHRPLMSLSSLPPPSSSFLVASSLFVRDLFLTSPSPRYMLLFPFATHPVRTLKPQKVLVDPTPLARGWCVFSERWCFPKQAAVLAVDFQFTFLCPAPGCPSSFTHVPHPLREPWRRDFPLVGSSSRARW